MIITCCSRSKSSQTIVSIISSVPKIIKILNMVIRVVPTAITNIKASHKTYSLVDDDTFFMMTPILWDYWMSSYSNVGTKRL